MSKISVIIPTFKRSDFIDRAIDSVLLQTYKDIEVIVVDDNGDSPQRQSTKNKLAKYEGDIRISYIQNERNLGGALARNVGIEAAVGDFVTFLDDDDVYLPDKLKVQYEEMVKNNWDMSFMDSQTYDSKNKLIDYTKHKIRKNPDYNELMVAHLMNHLTPTDTYMYKTEKIREIGGFDNVSSTQEFLLMLKSINAGLKIGYIPQSHVILYVHEGERISTSKKKVIDERTLLMIKKKYFGLLSKQQRNQVLCRHYSVVFYIEFRRKNYVSALWQAILAVYSSPRGAWQLFNEKKRMIM